MIHRPLFAVLLLSAASLAPAQTTDKLTTIDDPGGGRVVYGIFSRETTLQGTMIAMLRKVHENLGVRPQIGQFFQSRDGQSLATFFNLTTTNPAGKHLAGLVIVTMPGGSKPAGAVLFDDASHFKTSEPQLMKRLTQAFNKDAAKQSTDHPSSSPSSSGTEPHHGAPAPAAPLHTETVGDNSASIGLPSGWHITGGGAGSLHADGPKGESIHMGVLNQNIYDPNNPKTRSMIQYMSRGTVPYTVCPFTNDLVAAYKCVSTQNRQRQHKPPMSLNVISTKNLQGGQSGVPPALVLADIDLGDGNGPMKASILIDAIHQPGAMMWALVVNQANVPAKLADQEWPTITAMASSYRQNGRVIQQQGADAVAAIQAQSRANTARFEEHNKQMDAQKADFEAHMDNLDRQSKAMQNYTLDQSVLQDSQYPARGTVTNTTADAFVKANPDRFQIVSKQDWIKGVDY